MESRRALRWLWIAAAGAGIALGAGSGVAVAESGASDAGPGPSASESSQTAQPATGGSDVAKSANDVGKHQDSDGGSGDAGKPTGTVSAATVTVRHDDTQTAASVEQPKAAVDQTKPPVEQTKPAAEQTTAAVEQTKPVASAKQPDVAPEPVAAKEVETPVAITPAPSTSHAEAAPASEAQPQGAAAVQSQPEPIAAAEVSQVTPASTLAAPVARARPTPGPIATVVISLLNVFGLMPTLPPDPVHVVGVPAQSTPGTSSIAGVTGVVTGSSSLAIPVAGSTYTGAADWYFPTQADGTVQAQGVMLLQHGFLGSNFWYSGLAQDLAQRTNSIVVVPNIPSFGFFTCSGCTLSAVPMQQGVAALFVDPSRTALNASAAAAGYQGVLPENVVLTGHSAGGGLAAAAGGFYADAVTPATNALKGVVMYDGVSSNGTFAGAVASLDRLNVPLYQIAAPPQAWNANGQTTNDLVALHPNQFVGDVLANGSHVDSLIGGNPTIDFFSQLFIKPSPPGNTQAVYTLANGWINDMYAGLGPTNGGYGTYGAPDQYVVLGQAAAVVLGPPPVVDLQRYLGTWYEVGSVRQFFSIGLVNTTAVYSLDPDGSIRVENSGNYFFDNGPLSTIVGTALPVDSTNDKLNVTFFGPPSAAPPGNYWIVDLAPDYSWAIVSDPSGLTGFLLSRTRTVSSGLSQELLNRASVKGVKRWIIPTRQPAAARDAVSV
ncbi:lipocalin family protein [Mycolicibacterium sp. 050158]|uniref:lipocalin family protein n=1 Tax=Mycolicibacterium sp. 050158 TaxID=3090602 RepID=UPI00299E9DB6|nr:lipocalin family protein [Mycolicibacterium sp. 050158]MDX1888223.1 lipocalin family protein [Mycolicibacterium sp. 050158]